MYLNLTDNLSDSKKEEKRLEEQRAMALDALYLLMNKAHISRKKLTPEEEAEIKALNREIKTIKNQLAEIKAAA